MRYLATKQLIVNIKDDWELLMQQMECIFMLEREWWEWKPWTQNQTTRTTTTNNNDHNNNSNINNEIHQQLAWIEMHNTDTLVSIVWIFNSFRHCEEENTHEFIIEIGCLDECVCKCTYIYLARHHLVYWIQ